MITSNANDGGMSDLYALLLHLKREKQRLEAERARKLEILDRRISSVITTTKVLKRTKRQAAHVTATLSVNR